MITPTQPAWQTEIATAVHDPAVLLRRLELPTDGFNQLKSGAGFSLRVPESYISRIRRGDPTDPLLRQILPVADELNHEPGYSRDPVGDGAALVTPGVLHKYQGRVLLVTSGACPIHCRYCFRRHYPYGRSHACAREWDSALDYISNDESIHEVILSGGDPLTVSDERLATLAEALGRIPHLKRLRLHTRMPIVIPSRVDEHLLGWLQDSTLDKVIVVHVNHPNELDHTVKKSIRRLSDAGITLLNQSVLLKGVNDSAVTLEELSEVLFYSGILPYYLHQLDRVEGAAHFSVSDTRAATLMEGLKVRLPGYLIPRLVQEKAGAPYKLPL